MRPFEYARGYTSEQANAATVALRRLLLILDPHYGQNPWTKVRGRKTAGRPRAAYSDAGLAEARGWIRPP